MFMIVNYYLTAYPAVYGQFPQAIPQPIAAVAPPQREGKNKIWYSKYVISSQIIFPKRATNHKTLKKFIFYIFYFSCSTKNYLFDLSFKYLIQNFFFACNCRSCIALLDL